YGSAILCSDDANVREIIPFVSRPVTTYGIDTEAQVMARNVRADGTAMLFDVERLGVSGPMPTLSVRLNLPGRHNVVNALRAIAVATEMGVSDTNIASELETYKRVGRHISQVDDFAVPARRGGGTYTVVDDYGHHPNEMAATLAATRGAWPVRRIVLAFQPHRYTR